MIWDLCGHWQVGYEVDSTLRGLRDGRGRACPYWIPNEEDSKCIDSTGLVLSYLLLTYEGLA